MTPGPRSCLCGCRRTFSRSRSFPLCAAGTALVYARLKALPLLDEPNAASRRSNRVWYDEQAVRALLAGDVASAAIRVQFRADHGFYSNPDRALVATGA